LAAPVNVLVNVCLRIRRHDQRALSKALIMFGMRSLRQSLRDTWLHASAAMAGVAFMLLAMAAIQYDEVIAPRFEDLSDGWSDVAAGVGRRLASFSL
jgi:hypothetical protein